jgi:hypothetical protein
MYRLVKFRQGKEQSIPDAGQETGMSQNHLIFQLKQPAAEILSEIQEFTEKYGGKIQGDEKSGHVAIDFILGSITGNYTIEGEQLHLHITKKPFLVGYETIRSTIKEYVTGLA